MAGLGPTRARGGRKDGEGGRLRAPMFRPLIFAFAFLATLGCAENTAAPPGNTEIRFELPVSTAVDCSDTFDLNVNCLGDVLPPDGGSADFPDALSGPNGPSCILDPPVIEPVGTVSAFMDLPPGFCELTAEIRTAEIACLAREEFEVVGNGMVTVVDVIFDCTP